MSRFKTYLQVAIEKNVVKRALVIAFVVGFILNAINQGEHIIQSEFDQINFLKFLLTFFVPYIVSTYSSVFVKLSFISGEVAGIDAAIACKSCGKAHVQVYRGDIIPYCSYCNKKTKWKLVNKINPLKQLKDEKYKSMALFSDLNPAPVVRIDSKGLIIEGNPAAKVLFESDGIIGEKITVFFPEISKIDFKKCIEKNELISHIETYKTFHFHLEIKGASEIGIAQIYGSNITDLINVKKKADIMAMFVKFNPAPVLRFDDKGLILDSNSAANEVFHVKTIAGKNISEFIPEISKMNVKELINENKIINLNFSIDNKIFHLTLRGVSELNRCFLYGSDITELQAAKKEVASMALFAEMNPEPVFRFDKKYKIMQANPVANKVFPNINIIGIDVKEILPKVGEIDVAKFIKNNEKTTVVEHVGDRIFRFMIRGISNLEVCQIYGADITKRVQAEEEIRKQAENIQSSIRYARRIQRAVLPEQKEINRVLPDHFVLFKPRDIVSGDFYWVKEINNKIVAIAADSTGHGVPGAFMSMLGTSFLNEIVTPDKLDSPGQILDELRDLVKITLSSEETGASDGMDIALSIIDKDKMELLYAGAYNPLYIYRKNELIEYKADKMPIGMFIKEMGPFNSKKIKLEKNDMIYMFSDGYHDQLGGENEKKYSTRSFKEYLKKIHNKDTEQQKQLLDENIMKWMENYHQIDDIVVMGIRI